MKEAPNPAAPDIPFRCIVSTHVDDGRAMCRVSEQLFSIRVRVRVEHPGESLLRCISYMEY